MAIGELLPTGERTRRLALPVGLGILAGAAATYVALVDPNESGHYPPCPFLLLTGLYCPGCGTLRAMHALMHLDVPAAIGLNLLTVAVIPFFAYWWGRWIVSAWRGRRRLVALAPPVVIWSFGALVVAFWVVRNLPFGAFLAP